MELIMQSNDNFLIQLRIEINELFIVNHHKLSYLIQYTMTFIVGF